MSGLSDRERAARMLAMSRGERYRRGYMETYSWLVDNVLAMAKDVGGLDKLKLRGVTAADADAQAAKEAAWQAAHHVEEQDK